MFKDVIDHLPGGLLITDRESRVLYASMALERRTGFAVPEIVGKKPGQLWGGRMSREFYSTLWKTIQAKQAFVGEVSNAKKNGTKNTEHIFILPLLNEQGEITYFAEIHPELATREEERLFAQEFLARSREMKSQASFFSWIFDRLRQKSDGTVSEASFSLEHFQTAAQFFYEVLVAPMETLVAPRQADRELILAAQAEPEKFSLLYRKYVRKVEDYFLKRLSGDRVLAEDLTQEVFVKAFRYLPTFRTGNATYYTYLLHVAHSVLVNYYRKQEPSLLLPEISTEIAADPESFGEEHLEVLLHSLSKGEQEIMLAKYREGLKIKEIASRVGKTENAVKLILSRSRKKLKQALRKEAN